MTVTMPIEVHRQSGMMRVARLVGNDARKASSVNPYDSGFAKVAFYFHVDGKASSKDLGLVDSPASQTNSLIQRRMRR